MSILVDENTKVLVQGITGSFGARHARLSIDYGTQIVAGVTPTKGGQIFEHGNAKVPVFDTVSAAVRATGATVSVIFVPPAYAGDSILEAVDAGLELVVCITEGIPVMDMMRVRAMMDRSTTRLVGPNCPGIVTPGRGEKSQGGCRIGISPGYIHKRGNVGVVSRSGTLTYEAVWQLTELGYGQSTCVGIGGDPINGSSFRDILEEFEKDPATEVVCMIGEIGGPQEAEAAAYIQSHMTKPVIAYIAGLTAPKGRTMGHAGAIISAFGESASEKVEILTAAGVTVAENPSVIGSTIARVLQGRAA